MILTLSFIIYSLAVGVHSFTCDHNFIHCLEPNIGSLRNCTESPTPLATEDCSNERQFTLNDIVKESSAEISLHLLVNRTVLELWTSITLPDGYNRAHLTLAEFEDNKQTNCKVIKIVSGLLGELSHRCSWNKTRDILNKTYHYEVKTEKDNSMLLPKKLLFNLPDPRYFSDVVHISKRSTFSYIDYTNPNTVLLKIQSLPTFYNVSHYKVEAYREKDTKTHMTDARLLPAEDKPVLEFEYSTYGEEGYHYFIISVISEQCPEHFCSETITAKLYISRKSRSLLIGIVGAGLLLPSVLYIFYSWSCKYKHADDMLDTTEKILLLFNPCSKQHYEVITTLAKVIKSLTNIQVMLDPLNNKKDTLKQCTDTLITTSCIIYVTPPVNEKDVTYLELDCMTHNFIKKELQDPYSEKKIFVVTFPYTCKGVPSVLSECVKFELMRDFLGFIAMFQPITEESQYKVEQLSKELSEKIERCETEVTRVLIKI